MEYSIKLHAIKSGDNLSYQTKFISFFKDQTVQTLMKFRIVWHNIWVPARCFENINGLNTCAVMR